MVQIELAPGALDDIDEKAIDMVQHDVANLSDRVHELLEAIQVLTHSPMIGRPVKDGKRELVIGKGTRGYVALYRYVASIEAVFVLTLRAQRESGFKH